uniref:Uncharacterized protein n=1 Tax=Labrus bergylta TaxID=56723 RepID=A0A3Q3EKS6_9LABR
MSDDSVSSNGTCATEMSFEVEDFSPPESPVDSQVEHNHGLPDPYRTADDEDSEVQERMGDVSECHCCKLCPREHVCCMEVAKVTCLLDHFAGSQAQIKEDWTLSKQTILSDTRGRHNNQLLPNNSSNSNIVTLGFSCHGFLCKNLGRRIRATLKFCFFLNLRV